MTVEYIKYKNKKLPVKLGYYVMKMLQKNHGAGMEDVEKDISLYEPLLYYSLEQGHKIEKKEFTLKLEDMEYVLEECLFEFMSLIPKFFPDLEKSLGEVGNEIKKK